MTAELRWFWKEQCPGPLREWFQHRAGRGAPGGGATRVDVYVCGPGQASLGVKSRGGGSGIEIKGLVAVESGEALPAPLQGRIQVWAKWGSSTLQCDGPLAVSVRKTRWLRRFDATTRPLTELELGPDERPTQPVGPFPDEGCNVELTKVEASTGAPCWWTFGIEAFGSFERVTDTLRAVADHLAGTGVPRLADALEASYPEWLDRFGVPPSSP
jgi:hypothetical protein